MLDRTKEPGSQGEPLYMDVVTALANAGKTDIAVIGGAILAVIAIGSGIAVYAIRRRRAAKAALDENAA